MSLLDKLFTPTHIVALQKITQAITGLGTALMVAHFLSPEEQGYFYTMGSLLSSYTIFDLGLSSYLLQRSAQLSTGLSIDRFGKISPNGVQRNQFLAFAQWTFKWYRNAGIITLLTLAPIGFWILSHNTNNQFNASWLWPWFLIVGAVALNMPTIGIFAVLEGTGAIREIYLLRIGHYVTGAIMAWGFIAAGHGLYAQAFPILSTALICYGWFFKKHYANLRNLAPTDHKNINQNILPNIKHTAALWISNYIFLNIPVILSFMSGSIVFSGQLGLSIVIANVGGAVAMSSATARMPSIISQIQIGKSILAERSFFRSLRNFGIIYSLGSCVLIALVYTLSNYNMLSRLINPIDLSILLMAFAGFHITNTSIIYLRARGYSKFTAPHFIFSISIIPLSIIMSSLGIRAIVVSIFLCSTISLASILITLAHKRNNSSHISKSAAADHIF